MLRDIFTNRWILAAVSFLMLLSVACYLWYQHDIAPAKQEAAETAKLVREWETASNTDSETEQVADLTAADSTPQAAEKPITTATGANRSVPTSDATAANLTDQTPKLATTEEVRVSPHGFGPYPKIPDGLPQGFFDRELSRDHELLGRVRIKLYEQGIPTLGLSIDQSGRVYPFDKNQVYITWNETTLPGLGNVKYITGIEGDASVIREIENNARARDPKIPIPMQIEADIPTSVKVLDKSEEGFDAYAYLNLKR